MRPADLLLAKLQGVKPTGKGRWVACCPAHEDRSPSLSIREVEDGRLLIYDFGGCSATDVLEKVGMRLDDLFPDKIGHYKPPLRGGFTHEEVLICLEHESFVALLIIEAAQDSALTDEGLQRLETAVRRISNARTVAYGRR